MMKIDAGDGEAGFTIPETLTALMIVSLSLLAALGVSGLAVRAAGQSNRALAAGIAVLRFDRALRAMAEKVIIPYWEQGGEDAGPHPAVRRDVVRRNGALEIPWYNGKRGSRFRLSLDGEGRLDAAGPGSTTENGERLSSPEGLAVDSVEILRTRGDRPRGIRIVWSRRGGNAVSHALFGGFPPETGDGGN
jgi:type II secretory pathway pseudopilin PulG